MELAANTRTILGKKTKTLRAESLIPAVVYGEGKDAKSLAVQEKDFVKVYRQAGESALIDLRVDGALLKVIIKQVTREPVNGSLLHIDFQEVSMSKRIKTQVSILIVGEAPAVKEHGGVLVRSLNHLDIECLPQDLIPDYKVDVARLGAIGDVIRVQDLVFPTALHVLTKPETVVALIEQPRAEEEEQPVVAAAPDLSAVKTEQEEKRAQAQAKKEEEKSIAA